MPLPKAYKGYEKPTQSFQDIKQRSFSLMANKMAKIPAWPFLVVKNSWSYWPNDIQFVTLFYWDSSYKYLKKCDQE